MEVRLAPLAADDVRESYSWFKMRAPRLAERWVDAVDATIARVAEAHLLFPVVYPGVRRAIVRGFPFGVFFQELPGYLRVIAVVDLRRDPSTWSERK